jgi:hypothetical protein
MGKGIALAFKRRYPEMYDDYVQRCSRGEVQLGKPYAYRAGDRTIINFPTKQHWRSVSKLDDIVAGLLYLESHIEEWGITSIAVPPLGCGNGQLEWEVVGPTLYRYLSLLSIPVELYAPHDANAQLELLPTVVDPPGTRFVEPQWVAFTALLAELERQPYHWPVGRIFLQKIAYFANAAGLPTGLEWERSSYGPYASGLKRVVASLQNNGLIVESQRGRMTRVSIGPAYEGALPGHRPAIKQWSEPLRRTLDLVSRFDTHRSEVAATVHFASTALQEQLGRRPTASEVVNYVDEWKIRRNPPFERDEVLTAVVTLAARGWISVEADDSLESVLADLATA